MALRFYNPGGPNLLKGTSCGSTRLWNCFPWDVMPVNVTVLAGLTSTSSRKDLLLSRGQDLEEMTCLCPTFTHSCLSIFLQCLFVFVLFLHLPLQPEYSVPSTTFPPPIFLHTLFFFTYFSLCPSLSLLPWLLPSPNKMGRQEDWWKIQGPMMHLPFIIVLLSLSLSLLNLYLFQVFN